MSKYHSSDELRLKAVKVREQYRLLPNGTEREKLWKEEKNLIETAQGLEADNE